MNELLEDTAIVLVWIAAAILGVMILIVIGTILLNASLTWGWAAFVAGLVLAVWGVFKIPVPRDMDSSPTQKH